MRQSYIDMNSHSTQDKRSMRAWLVLTLVAALGCSDSATGFFRSTPNFYKTAQENYEAGIKELKNGNFLTARQFFSHIKSRFGFSKWATLAELGIADCSLGQEKYTEAIDDYKQFIRSHPTHERTQDGYAAFKIGEAYHKQIPSDWFLAPPSYEKDQGPVNDALRELAAFVDQYPESPYAPPARKLLGDAVRRLADHELYVASFYLNRNKPHAAIGRLEYVLREYPGAQREPEALLLLGKTYLQMEKPSEARKVFEKLATDHPNDYRAGKARLYIQHIDKRWGGKT
jgi:outer membrane protein assembly factor BamD